MATAWFVSHAGSVNDRPPAPSDSPSALAAALRTTGYLADDGLATATFL
ncbi:MAG: ATPase, partial [Pseudonocardia sp.]|nr:ATPase [Pseudonocardia sp.]